LVAAIVGNPEISIVAIAIELVEGGNDETFFRTPNGFQTAHFMHLFSRCLTNFLHAVVG
jgi:hypothetical protein